MRWFELIAGLLTILAGAELFTGGVEWIGQGMGLSEGMVGSVLAAIGTALPETTLPFVAILTGHGVGKDIGVGAILGAPFMLSTLAMFVLGASALAYAGRGRRAMTLGPQRHVISQDLTFFVGMYSLAIVAGLLHVKPLDWAVAGVLVISYGWYVRRHYRTPGEEKLEEEAAGEIRPLRIWAMRSAGRPGERPADPPRWASAVQTLLGLALIIVGARIFVAVIKSLAARFGIPDLPFALLLAPVATELPEQFNAVLWLRRRKDTLAVGNVTGAMVFQASFPVTVGLLFTPWRLEGEALAAALVSLAAALFVLASLRLRGRLSAPLLLAQGALYAGYVTYVLTRL